MKIMWNTLLLLSVWTCSANVQAAEPQRAFSKADLEPSSGISYANFVQGSVEFYLPMMIDIDWANLAPEKIKLINTKKLSRADIDYINAGDEFFSVKYLKFELPVAPALKMHHFYLISSLGVEELKLARLSGMAKFQLMQDGKVSSEPIEYYGKIIADTSLKRKAFEGGFVLSSPVPLNINVFSDAPAVRKLFTAHAQAGEINYFYNAKNQKLKLTVQRNHLEVIDHIFTFRIAGIDAAYLFVNWQPDEKCEYGCCGNGYSLFRVDQELRELTGTVLGCDV